ncbi:LysR family transcriptional regulator [Variovorax sp. HJSM1_2]|uniref:LysR family transcriptional regulator n=1 Tax=Variovorax sp. HJSM1_2 TaxID=3366263 RepID=UPI003BCD6B5D
MLNSSLLRCFLAVLEHRTLTAAASALCITQPALSKSIRRLEEELGVPLFERTPGGMVVTSYGIALAHRARLMELESQRAHAELALLRGGGVGTVTIGIGPLWSVYGLPEVIAELTQAHPSLRIRVVPGVLNTLLPQLLRGELDMVCAALDFPEHEELETEHLIDSHHVILAHARHPLARAKRVTVAELGACRFVGLHNDYAVLDRMKRYFALRGLGAPGFTAEVESLELLLSLVATGAFVATQSNQVLLRAAQLGIEALPTEESIWAFRGGVVSRKTHVPVPGVALVREALRRRLTPGDPVMPDRPSVGHGTGPRHNQPE